MDLAQMVINAAAELTGPMWRLLWVIASLTGLLCVGNSLIKLVRASSNPAMPPVGVGDILPILLIGGLLWNLSEFISQTWQTFGQGAVTYGAISYEGGADFGRFKDAIDAVLTIASIGGGFLFWKGLVLLKKASINGQASNGSEDFVWRALTHMFGGAMLVQIPDVIEAFRQTFGLYW